MLGTSRNQHLENSGAWPWPWLLKLGLGLTLTHAAQARPTALPPPRDQLPPEFSIHSPKERKDLDYFLLQLADRRSEQAFQWWAEYQRGLLWQSEDPALSCQKFRSLADYEEFPARQVAAVRTLSVCDQGHSLSEDVPGWLLPLRDDQLLLKYRRTQDTAKVIEGLIEKSKRSLPINQKQDLVQEALGLAEKLPKSKENKKILARTRVRLYQIAPRFNPKPEFKDYLAVAYDLRKARRFKEAEKFYNKVLKSTDADPALKIKAYYGIAACHKNSRDREAHIRHLKSGSKLARITYRNAKTKKARTQWAQQYSEVTLDLARAQWTQGHRDEGQKSLERMLRDTQNSSGAAMAYWILGRMADEAGNHNEAVRLYETGLALQSLSDSEKERLLWSLAWSHKKHSAPEKALELLKTGAEQSTVDFSQFRFRFWQAKSLQQLERKNEASTIFETLVSEDPLGFYGLMAQRELGQKLHLPEPTGEPLSASFLKDHMRVDIFEWLISLSETDAALALLDETATGLRRLEKKQGVDLSGTWTELFRDYGRAGQYLKLFEQMGRINSHQRSHILSHHPELLFPEPFPEVIQSAADAAQVEPELILAIIRQESSFNPFARSPADAFGLMQLLPEVAEKKAGVAKVSFSRPEDLYTPEINIPLGAHFLSELAQQFQGQFIPMVASYNASQSAIKRWLTTHYRGDVLEFVEDIPYEETRGYVRLVLRNLVFYKLLRHKEKSIQFPEWTLKLNDSKKSIAN